MLRRRKTALSLEAMLEQAASAEHPPHAPQTQVPGPEEVAIEAETRRQVRAALAALPTTTAPPCCSRTACSILHRAGSVLRQRLCWPADA